MGTFLISGMSTPYAVGEMRNVPITIRRPVEGVRYRGRVGRDPLAIHKIDRAGPPS
jgi:hypothetical protein